jgi:hypothetical protein
MHRTHAAAEAATMEAAHAATMKATHAATVKATHAAAMETTATAVEPAAAAMPEGHRTGGHSRCQSDGHCAGEKLFPHKVLLNSVVHQYWLVNQRRPRPSGCGDGAAGGLKLLL